MTKRGRAAHANPTARYYSFDKRTLTNVCGRLFSSGLSNLSLDGLSGLLDDLDDRLGSLSDLFLNLLGNSLDRLSCGSCRLFCILGNLSSDALACCLDLLAKLVVLLFNFRLHVSGDSLNASSGGLVSILALGSYLSGNFLALSSNFLALGHSLLINLLSAGGSLVAKLLGVIPNDICTLGNRSTGLLAATRSEQQSGHSTNSATNNERNKCSHNASSIQKRLFTPHYRPAKPAYVRECNASTHSTHYC